MSHRRPRNSRFVTMLFLGIFALVTLLFLRLLAVFLSAVVLALVLVSLFFPLFRRVLCWCRERRQLAAVLTTALVVVVVLLPLSLVLTSLSREAIVVYQRATAADQPFVEQLVGIVQGDNPLVVRARELADTLGVDVSAAGMRANLILAAKTVAGMLYNHFGGLASNIFKILLHFALMLLVVFAVFAEGPRIKAYLLDLSPLPDEQEEEIVGRFATISRAVFLGNGLSSALQGFFGGVGFYLFGIGSGALWGSAIAFFAFLPILGATAVFIPASLYLYLTGSPAAAVGFLIYNAVYAGIFEYGLKPRLIGGQTKMSGVLIFLGILAGISVFGILGLFYGPLILTMFLTVAEIYKTDYRADLMAVVSPWVQADAGCLPAEGPAPTPESAPEPECPSRSPRAPPQSPSQLEAPSEGPDESPAGN